MFQRILVIVLDSVGIGQLPDAAEYGDTGTNTLGHLARSQGGLFLPTLTNMGLGCIDSLEGIPVVDHPTAWIGKMAEVAKGKDTTTGHWEMVGCPLQQPLPLYPRGFPLDITGKISAITGRRVIGNKAASGTDIITELGEEHINTGSLIVYTSADSVLQIAAHETIIPLAELNEIGQSVRNQVCVGQHGVGRVIIRPFTGSPGHFSRTSNRHDFSLAPPNATVLDFLQRAGKQVIGIGKIADIFAGRGITQSFPTVSNDDGMEKLFQLTEHNKQPGLIFANLVEFDSLYGHRNDVVGYARALERVDGQLALLLPLIGSTDLLMITADHGCDPTTAGTDHTREYVPLLAYSPAMGGGHLGIRQSFADIGATIAANFQLAPIEHGKSFLADMGVNS